MRRLAACLVSLVLLSACGSQHLGKPASAAPVPVVSSYTIVRDVLVSPADWPKALLADVYQPAGTGPFPSVLLVHGGAWKRGDRAQVKGLAERIAARGYLVVNTTYRLVPEHIFPAQLHDVQQALQWMHSAEATRLGVDRQRIGGFGYSAGGHLVALAAAACGDAQFGAAQTCLKALVAGGTPSDLKRYQGGYLVPNFLGGSQQQKPQAYVDASPISYLKPGHPPVFQYHATLDDYVPFEQATLWRAALDAAQVPNELFVIKGHGHISAFFADGDAVEASLAFLDRYLR